MQLDASWYEDDEWRGYVLTEPRGDLAERHVFETWVAGLSHYPSALRDPSFAPGREIVLRPEPDSPFDPNAIGVWNANGTVQAGHVPAVVAADLPSCSADRRGVIAGEMFEGAERRAMWIVVAREPVTFRVVDEGLCRPGGAARWVRHAKDLLHASQEWIALRTVDPLEQMREMTASLRPGDQIR